MSTPTENLTGCDPVALDLWLRHDADHADVHRALAALGDDILDMLPIVYRDQPDTLNRRLVAWGYCIASIVGNTRQIVASPAPARGSAGRSGAGNGATGRVSAPPSDQAGAPPSNEHRPVAANDEPAVWATAIAQRQV